MLEAQRRSKLSEEDPSASGADVESESPVEKDTLWARITSLLADKEAPPPIIPPKEQDAESVEKRRRRKHKYRLTAVVAIMLWVYAFAKVFIGDFDRALVELLAPSIAWVLDFRFFIVLGVLALVLALFKRAKLAGPLAYVALFPIILVVWHLPKLLIRVRSPQMALGILNVLGSAFMGFKRTIIGAALASFSILAIVLGPSPWLVAPGIVCLSVLLLVWLWLAMRKSLKPSRFISGQQSIISKLVNSKALDKFRAPDQVISAQTLETWTEKEATDYVTNAGTALVVYRSAYFWAYTLDQYRRGSAGIIFNAISVAVLFIEIGIAFGFLNYGLFRLDPAQFAYSTGPSFLSFDLPRRSRTVGPLKLRALLKERSAA